MQPGCDLEAGVLEAFFNMDRKYVGKGTDKTLLFKFRLIQKVIFSTLWDIFVVIIYVNNYCGTLHETDVEEYVIAIPIQSR